MHKTKKIQIKDLQIGQKIKTYENGKIVYKMVEDVFPSTVPKGSQFKVTFNSGSEVHCSYKHPIICDAGNGTTKQIRAIDLSEADSAISDAGHTTMHSIEPLDIEENFIDITVKDTHVFFTSHDKDSEMVLTHNTQNGIRGGSATLHFPWWHSEIEDLIVLKNNKGTEDNRIRNLDYSVQFNKLFYERVLAKKDISLFSPHEVPGLYDAFFADQNEFKELYEEAENNPSIRKKVINSKEFVNDYLMEALETGRIYLMNVDNVNDNSPFIGPIHSSNLCQEITLPVIPLDHIDDTKGEIALCTLSAINLGKISANSELERLCDLAVRGLDKLLDYQDYPLSSTKTHAPKRRSLGVGYIGLAHYLAKKKVKYNDEYAHELMHELSESFQFYLLKSSTALAEEVGACEYYDKTTYSQGILPIDRYKKSLDAEFNYELKCDWESLRADIKTHGLRNSTLSAQMPAESSAVACNETNGIEPARSLLTVKQSKKGVLKQIVPGYPTLKNFYDLQWDHPDMSGYIKIVAIMQKFFDQSISANLSYNPTHYEGNMIPLNILLHDMLTTYKLGWKTRYYVNTMDGSDAADDDEDSDCAACVV